MRGFVLTKKSLVGLIGLFYLAALVFSLVPARPAAALAPIRVNAGGGALTDSRGRVWQADFGYNTSQTNSTSASIAGTNDDKLYQTERWDWTPAPELTYNFPVPNDVYQVRLHFAEIYGLTSYPGGRVFDVGIENDPVLDNLDIFAEVGANTALVKEFATTVADNKLTINFTHGAANNPQIAAIEIIPVNAWPKHPEFGPGPGVDMMVVGDSYSVGNGGGETDYFFKSIDDPRPNALVRQRDTTPPSLGCFRNHNTWGEYAFRKSQDELNNTGAFVNAACSGDATANITGLGAPSQLNGFDATRRKSMDLIALTIGGNDLGFGNVVVNCFFANSGQTCHNNLTAGEAMLHVPPGSYSEIFQRTRAVLEKLRTEWPNAKIVLVGYPLFREDRAYSLSCATCPGGVVRPVQRLESGLNSLTLQQVALVNLLNQQTPGRFAYLPLHTGNNQGFFDGHGLNGTKETWINLNTPDVNGWYHPNAAGYAAIGDHLLELPLVQQQF